MSDNDSSSLSGSDMETDDVTEGANIRVVQSSMHASIMQNSLFKVVENKKESEKDSESEDEKVQEPSIVNDNTEFKEETKSIEPEKSESIEIHEDKPQPSEPIEKNEPNKVIEIIEKIPEKSPPPKEKKYSKTVQAILAEPKPKKIIKIDVEKRFYDYQSRVNKKVTEMQEEKMSKELEGCTFAPKINRKTEKRDFDQFIKHIENYSKAKTEKLERIKKDKLESELPTKGSFKPTLSEKTIKLTKKNKSPEPIHERLYKESEVLKKKHEELSKLILEQHCSFKPKLNEQSENLKREGLTTQRLYEKSKEKPKEYEFFYNMNKEKHVNEVSESMIVDKFNKEVEEAFPNKAEEEAPMLNYVEFVEIIRKLGFLKQDNNGKGSEKDQKLCEKAFKSLGEGECVSVSIEKAKNFIYAIVNLDPNPSRLSKKQHLEYFDFYKTRQNIPKTKKTRAQTPVGFLFRPVLDENSEKIAAGVMQKRTFNLGNAKIENILLHEYKKAIEKLENMKKDREQEQLDCPECTFHPKTYRGPKILNEEFKDNFSLISDYMKLCGEKSGTRNEMLYWFSKVENEKKERLTRTVDDMEYEKNMGECSFNPSLDKPKISKRVVKEIKGVSENVERMRKARNEEEKNQGENYGTMRFGIDFKPRICNESEKKVVGKGKEDGEDRGNYRSFNMLGLEGSGMWSGDKYE
ncbi:hypothetical protein SteCoe_16261 [Stentor coeruleus]|uniref:Uncharacterized protein n=1 Tax=Stentor coeruleus TaxID=5963 RepID=A0A1R2C1M5_9CILI|nr:hypothetical protein SteCoe_16261 [Stentor coeruleus]